MATVHNDFLSHIYEDYTFNENITNYQPALENFAEDSYDFLLSSNYPVERIWIDSTVHYINTSELSTIINSSELIASLNSLHSEDLIDDFELNSINRILDAYENDLKWDEFVLLN